MELQARLEAILAEGLSSDAIHHAEQVAQVVAILYESFAGAGLRSTVVGGSAIELHAPGVYVSGDIDLVVEPVRPEATGVEVVFENLGFQRVGRHWRHGDLFVEVPSSWLSDPSEPMRVGDAVFEIVTKEVVLADRIIGFRQWGVLAYAQQAIDLLAAFGDDVNREWLSGKLRREGSLDALGPLETLARSDEVVSEGMLRELLSRLRREA